MSAMREKIAWALAVVLGIAVVASFAGVVRGGPLDPTSGPNATMKTLDEIPPSWHQNLSATGGCTSARFRCVFPGDAAVLDKETGLVWDRQPEADLDWGQAVSTCRGATIGGRKGWRLPSFGELQTLLEPTLPAPRLPTGHPFSGVLGTSLDYYWTTNLSAIDSNLAWTVSFNTGAGQAQDKGVSLFRHVWCVRAPEAPAPPF